MAEGDPRDQVPVLEPETVAAPVAQDPTAQDFGVDGEPWQVELDYQREEARWRDDGEPERWNVNAVGANPTAVNTLPDVPVWGTIDSAAETNIVGKVEQNDKRIGSERVSTLVGDKVCSLYETNIPAIGSAQASLMPGKDNLVTMYDVYENTLGFSWLYQIPPGGIKVGAPYVYTKDGAIECPAHANISQSLSSSPKTQKSGAESPPSSSSHIFCRPSALLTPPLRSITAPAMEEA